MADNSLLPSVARICDQLNEWCGRVVAWLTLLMVLVTVLVVVLRYGFDQGWIWMQESVTWMYALVFLVGAGYTLRHDEHVRVDIFYREMSPHRQALVDILGILLLLLPTCVFIFWTSIDFVAESWRYREGSREAGGLPGVFLLKTVIPLMALLVILQGGALLLQNLARLRKN